MIGGFSKQAGPGVGVSLVRIIVYLGVYMSPYRDPPIYGK